MSKFLFIHSFIQHIFGHLLRLRHLLGSAGREKETSLTPALQELSLESDEQTEREESESMCIRPYVLSQGVSTALYQPYLIGFW